MISLYIIDLCFFNRLKLATHIFRFVLTMEFIEAALKRPAHSDLSSAWRLDIP